VPSAVAPPATAAPAPVTPPAAVPPKLDNKDLEQQIAADRKYARALAKEDRTAAQWLRSILGNERRRSAVADALAGALTSGNGADPAASADRMKKAFAGEDEIKEAN
jgi:hypothetical protein